MILHHFEWLKQTILDASLLNCLSDPAKIQMQGLSHLYHTQMVTTNLTMNISGANEHNWVWNEIFLRGQHGCHLFCSWPVGQWRFLASGDGYFGYRGREFWIRVTNPIQKMFITSHICASLSCILLQWLSSSKIQRQTLAINQSSRKSALLFIRLTRNSGGLSQRLLSSSGWSYTPKLCRRGLFPLGARTPRGGYFGTTYGNIWSFWISGVQISSLTVCWFLALFANLKNLHTEHLRSILNVFLLHSQWQLKLHQPSCQWN